MIALIVSSAAWAQDMPAPETTPTPEAAPVAQPAPAVEPAPAAQPPPAAAPAEPRREKLLRYGFDVQLGSMANSDPAWDFFGGQTAMPSFGLAASARVHPNLAIVGAWHYVRKGSVIVANGGTDTDAPDIGGFTAAYFAHEISAGVRGDVAFDDVFLPFLKVQGLLLTSLVKLDDDPDVNDNPGQEEFSGASPGFLTTAGFEVRLPPYEPVQIGLEIEAGYGWLAATDLDELGEMKAGGFVIRTGVGVRF
jgi:hypothetical protein